MYNPNEPSSLTRGPPGSSKLSHSLDREIDIKPSVIAAFHLFSSLNAEEGVAPWPAQPSPVPHRQPGCPGSKKTQFLTQLIKALSSHMLQSRLMTIPYRRFPDSLAAPSLEDRAVRWQFTHLDRDFSNGVSERELRPFKLYMKQNARPKRCVRKFLDYCDLSGNKLISLPEFRGCLGLS
ncbi:hypothetical protein E2320_000807 [Naja naja]|nr:hypothetical protein E2320_000807 [Naja naja]